MDKQREVQANAQTENGTGEHTTVYDVWQKADGLHKGEAFPKRISFKNGFVRVRKSDWVTVVQEGWSIETEQTFDVPPWHSCEVLGNPDIKFTRT